MTYAATNQEPMAVTKDAPWGMRLLQPCFRNISQAKLVLIHRAIILFLTFLSYTCYHMTRKSLSVVKNVLNRNCTNVTSDLPHNSTTWCDWAPFDDTDHDALLSGLDSAFLFSYAIAMFASGIIAERVNLRYFLSFGMISSGIFCCLLGLAYTWQIHSLAYFIVIQIFFGITQTTGWPAVVAVCGHWFGKDKQGLIFGVWNSHTSIGNIVGSLLAGVFVKNQWSFSFIVPGIIMGIIGIVIYLFLVIHPVDVGCPPVLNSTVVGVNVSGYEAIPQDDFQEDETEEDSVVSYQPSVCSSRSARQHVREQISHTESSPILTSEPDRAIGFIDALKIPGVVEFSLTLFFAKLVSYTFLFWLPKYIADTVTPDPEESADLSTIFDVGGIIGAIVAGVISDSSGMPASTCVSMFIASIPSLVLYQLYGASDYTLNIVLLLVGGAFVNGPYALITTAVSAALGTHESLNGNAKALATVTAIIDGTGSFGAAVGPLLAGLVSPTGWQNVFYLLIGADVLALILLSRLTYWELLKWRRERHRSL